MYLWRFSIAITLGLVWYFSDCGRTVTQYCLCFLFCLSSPLLSGNSGRESATQTDEETSCSPLQDSCKEESCVDGVTSEHTEPPESQYPHVKRSLQQVFECAYAQLVLPWYGVPEPCDDQPLHQVLSREFDFVIDRVIERARDFDLCQAVVGSIRILTQHLHNAKQSDRELLFSSRAEEIAVLREFSDTLVRNLFPKSLWGQEVNRCALNEIIALKGLGLLVTWLSDPDNLNQLVVSQLDSVTPKSSAEELCGSDPDQVSLASQEDKGEGEGSEVSLEGAGISNGSGIKGKTKGNKLKKGWSKFMEKMKSKRAKKKKMKKMEQELMMRIMAIQGDVSADDDVTSMGGSVHSQEDSDREDSDLDEYLTSVQEDMMEFKLSYEMWRFGRWTVSIPHAEWDDEEEDVIFTVHLEEKDSPENLQWDIRKSYTEVIYFRNRWQDATSLPVILELEVSEVNIEVKEEARLSVEHFLQELVSDNLIGHTQPVFQFLCPLDKLLNEEEHYGGVWGLLSGLAYFLTPTQEEEENLSPRTDAPKEVTMPCPQAKSTSASLQNHSACTAEKGSDVPDAALPTIVISECKSPSEVPEETETETDSQPAIRSDCSSNENSSQEKADKTSPFKMIIKGLTRSRSQDSLASSKPSCEEDLSESGCNHNGDSQREIPESPSWLLFSARSGKKEKTSGGVNKAQGKETQSTLQRGEDSQCQKNQVNWEQLEATKAIFDLLKEISGNSILINIFDAILKPVMPILKKKLNAFLNKVNPTEAQMAGYIDAMRDAQWPESQPAAPPPPPPPPSRRTDEQKDETRERAHNLINARYSNFLVLKKTDVESVFNLLQNGQENKTLIYMLLSFLLKELFPNEPSLNLSAVHKVTNAAN